MLAGLVALIVLSLLRLGAGIELRAMEQDRDDSNGIEEGWATDQRFPLSSDVAPGESVTLRVTVTGPSASGTWRTPCAG